MAPRHWVCINFVQLFYWKKPCQDSCWHTSVVSWISTADQGVAHFPLFFKCLHLFKEWENLFDVTAAHNSSTPRLASFPLCDSVHEGTNQAFGPNSFYSGTLMICCRAHYRNFLVRFCLLIMGFPLALLPWSSKTHKHNCVCVRDERKQGVINVSVISLQLAHPQPHNELCFNVTHWN